MVNGVTQLRTDPQIVFKAQEQHDAAAARRTSVSTPTSGNISSTETQASGGTSPEAVGGAARAEAAKTETAPTIDLKHIVSPLFTAIGEHIELLDIFQAPEKLPTEQPSQEQLGEAMQALTKALTDAKENPKAALQASFKNLDPTVQAYLAEQASYHKAVAHDKFLPLLLTQLDPQSATTLHTYLAKLALPAESKNPMDTREQILFNAEFTKLLLIWNDRKKQAPNLPAHLGKQDYLQKIEKDFYSGLKELFGEYKDKLSQKDIKTIQSILETTVANPKQAQEGVHFYLNQILSQPTQFIGIAMAAVATATVLTSSLGLDQIPIIGGLLNKALAIPQQLLTMGQPLLQILPMLMLARQNTAATPKQVPPAPKEAAETQHALPA